MKHTIKTTLFTAALLLGSTNLSANESTEPDLANGAKVWAETCMRCHNVRTPDNLSKRAWIYSMNHMRVRAGLTGQETRDVLAFILSSKTSSDGQRVILK